MQLLDLNLAIRQAKKTESAYHALLVSAHTQAPRPYPELVKPKFVGLRGQRPKDAMHTGPGVFHLATEMQRKLLSCLSVFVSVFVVCIIVLRLAWILCWLLCWAWCGLVCFVFGL